MQLRSRSTRSGCVMIERENNPVGIENCLPAHGVEIINGHGSGTVRAERAIHIANHNVAGARVHARMGGEYFFADGFAGHSEERFCQSLAARLAQRRPRGERAALQRTTFAMKVMTSEFTMSIRNAPTTGTTRKASGAGPYFSTSSCIEAIALAVIPSMNPQNPL